MNNNSRIILEEVYVWKTEQVVHLRITQQTAELDIA